MWELRKQLALVCAIFYEYLIFRSVYLCSPLVNKILHLDFFYLLMHCLCLFAMVSIFCSQFSKSINIDLVYFQDSILSTVIFYNEKSISSTHIVLSHFFFSYTKRPANWCWKKLNENFPHLLIFKCKAIIYNEYFLVAWDTQSWNRM